MDSLGDILQIILVIGFMVWLFCNEKRHEKIERDLLNRIMAKDYKEYAVFEERKLGKPQDAASGQIRDIFNSRDVFPVD